MSKYVATFDLKFREIAKKTAKILGDRPTFLPQPVINTARIEYHLSTITQSAFSDIQS